MPFSFFWLRTRPLRGGTPSQAMPPEISLRYHWTERKRSPGAEEVRAGLDQMGWLAVAGDTGRLYGFWGGGKITQFDPVAKTGRVIEENPFSDHSGEPQFSSDGRWLVVHAVKQGEPYTATHLVDTTDWTVVRSWEGYHFSRAFAPGNTGLYLFSERGVELYDFGAGTTSLYCAVPGAQKTFVSRGMVGSDNALILFGYNRFTVRSGIYDGCPYRVGPDGLDPLQRLEGITGSPCPGNTEDGPYWFYDVDPKRVSIQVKPNQWDVANEDHPTYGILYRLSADGTKVRTWECSSAILCDLLPDENGLRQETWPLSIFVAPDKKHIVGVYDRGYRFPGYMIIGDAETGEWLRAYRATRYGMTNVVFWNNGVGQRQ